MTTPMTLQQLHDLEIAGGIEWTYDGAWRVTIGSPVLAEARASSEDEAMTWLTEKAAELYGITRNPGAGLR